MSYRPRQRFARLPVIVVLIHIGVIFDMTPERAVEVPEPVRSQLMAPRPPEGLIPLLLKAATGHHQLGRAAEMEGKVFNTGHKRRSLDQKQGMVIPVPAGRRKGPTWVKRSVQTKPSR